MILDRNSALYYKSAKALRLPIKHNPAISGFAIILGDSHYFFRSALTPFNSGSSSHNVIDKYLMNKLLASAGLPVPKAKSFNKKDFLSNKLEDLINDLKFPLVAKPTANTATGRDVLCNIKTIEELYNYMQQAYERYDNLSVEEFHGGLNSYRVLVFKNKVIGVVQRYPATIVGNGLHTIEELIAQANIRRRSLREILPLGDIKIDAEYEIRFKELNITAHTIPKNGERIVLCYTCNSTRGGNIKSLGKAICKENAQLFCKAANALGIDLAGFDVECENILTPILGSRGVIIEANYNPDVSIHENALHGIKTQVTKKILLTLIYKHPLSYIRSLFTIKAPAINIRYNNIYLKTAFFALLYYIFRTVIT